MPWARDPSTSFLLTAAATRQKLQAAGFRLAVLEDQTADAFAKTQARANAATSPSDLGLHLLLGEDAPTMYGNTLRSYTEDRIGLIQGIAVRMD